MIYYHVTNYSFVPVGPGEVHSLVMGTSGIQFVSFSTLNQIKNGGYDGGESVVSMRWELNLAR